MHALLQPPRVPENIADYALYIQAYELYFGTVKAIRRNFKAEQAEKKASIRKEKAAKTASKAAVAREKAPQDPEKELKAKADKQARIRGKHRAKRAKRTTKKLVAKIEKTKLELKLASLNAKVDKVSEPVKNPATKPPAPTFAEVTSRAPPAPEFPERRTPPATVPLAVNPLYTIVPDPPARAGPSAIPAAASPRAGTLVSKANLPDWDRYEFAYGCNTQSCKNQSFRGRTNLQWKSEPNTSYRCRSCWKSMVNGSAHPLSSDSRSRLRRAS